MCANPKPDRFERVSFAQRSGFENREIWHHREYFFQSSSSGFKILQDPADDDDKHNGIPL